MSDELLSSLPWPVRPLGELTSKVGSGSTPRGGKERYLSRGTAFIRSQNVLDHTLSLDKIARIDEEAANALRHVEVHEGDVLLNITGDSITRCCLVEPDALPARVSQHVAIIRTTQELNARFLQKYLTQAPFKKLMLSMSVGGTRQALTKTMIENFPIAVPPKREQDAVATVLGALDDKIAVNDRVAARAQELAQAHFESTMKETRSEVFLGSLINLAYGKALREPDRRPGRVPVFGCTGQIGWHDTPLSRVAGAVVGRKGAYAGTVTWSPEPCWVIDTAFYVEAKESETTAEFAYFALKNAGLHGLVGDSAVPGLNRNVALAHPIPVPDQAAIERFTSRARILLAAVDSAKSQNHTLAELRDTLSPKLMSGRIRVVDAEKIVEDVT